MKKILIIEDDSSIAELERDYLEINDFECEIAARGTTGLEKALAENPNHTFSKEVLFDRIWGMDAIGDVSTVTVHIQRVRDKINTENERYIETIWGVGYRFNI